MKRKTFVWVLMIFFVLIFLFATTFANSSETASAPVSGFSIRNGINISEWMERENSPYEHLDTLFSRSKIDLLCSLGFDHIRIPVNETVLFDESLAYRSAELALLHDRIGYAIGKGLKVILDFHRSRGHFFLNEKNVLFFDSSAGQHFLNVWLKLQQEFSRYSTDSLAYECLNEPAAPINEHGKWNELVAKWIDLIRKKEKNRFLVIGSNRGNQLWTFKYLKVPKNDKKLILSFHFYQPSVLTHYKASWSELKDYDGPAVYPGQTIPDSSYRRLPDSLKQKLKYGLSVYDKESIRKEIANVVKISREYGMPLNVGEFGCRRNVPDLGARKRWIEDLVSLFEEYNISHTFWGMNGAGFGIWNYDRTIDSQLIKLLKAVQ